MSPASTHKYLHDRAHMLAEARAFFAKRSILEVDPGALVKCPPNDSHIDVLSVEGGKAYLHTSPEYAMKRLLSLGIRDCYFLGHVYRKGEVGRFHNPEFTMVEWYRLGISFEEMIQETCEFLFLFFRQKPIRQLSYREAFSQYVGINYSKISLEDLQKLTQSAWDKDTCMHYLMTHKIEPHLGHNELTVLTDYPVEEAALACVQEKNGEKVARRYEIYYEGVELCNGYHELSDAKEIRSRFMQKNAEREKAGKEPYALDEKFLSALKSMPDCCGVALGFDRALMLRHKLKSIKEVIPFAWDEL
jgi:lysyl-tRNA synthetase class 2